jgi:hypothetical protein
MRISFKFWWLPFVFSFSAQGQEINWFNPYGENFSCLLNPAVPCPLYQVQPTVGEKLKAYESYSQVAYTQNNLYSLKSKDYSLRESRNHLDLELYTSVPGGAGLGFIIKNPWSWSSLVREADSIELRDVPPNVSLSLWLGADLLHFAEQKHQLWISAELPFNYEPGKWELRTDYIHHKLFRGGLSWSRQEPRDEIGVLNPNEEIFKYRWQKEVYHGEAGLNLYGAALGVFGDYIRYDASDLAAALTQSGDGIRAGGHVLVGGRRYRLKNAFQYDRENRRVFTPDADSRQIDLPVHNRNWVFKSDWSLIFKNQDRLDFFASLEKFRSSSDQAQIQMDTGGSSWLKYYADSVLFDNSSGLKSMRRGGGLNYRRHLSIFFAEPFYALYLNETEGEILPWAFWGLQPWTNPVSDQWLSSVTGFKIGLETIFNLYTYELRIPINHEFRAPVPGYEYENGVRHEFKIRSRF